MPRVILENQQYSKLFEKVRIGFYLGNNGIPNADLRFPEKGNPGIGGSEFGSIALPYFFSLYYHDFDLVIYANVNKYLPDRLVTKQFWKPMRSRISVNDHKNSKKGD